MNSPAQQIKERLDIVEVVSGYLKLERTGINLRACCPFHQEKKPSFFVSPARQSFRCFGCQKSGDVFTFVQEIEGIEFGDALRILARRAGVELQSYKADPRLRTQRERLYKILEITCLFFEKQLQATQTGKQVEKYLAKRGLSRETIKKWRLGWAPDQWRALSDFLVSLGYSRDEIGQSGLTVSSEKAQTPYDRFRGRIMFPIFDLNSQVIGFGGRVFTNEKLKMKNEKLEEVTAKYINIQNSALYDKSRALYGLNFAKMSVRQKDSCILTEGYMDVILSHQAGFENTVAASGTALTPFQLQILKRYTNNLLTAFDMDKAGGLATMRGIELAQKQGFNIKVIAMEQEKDPADIILQNPKDWQKAVSGAENIMDFYLANAISRFDRKTPEGKKEIANAILPVIKKIPSSILQFHWAQKLAQTIRVSEEAIVDELKKILAQKPEPTARQPEPTFAPVLAKSQAPKPRNQLLEEKLFALVMNNPENLEYIDGADLACLSPHLQTILTECQKVKTKNRDDFEKVFEALLAKDDSLKVVIDDCCFKAEIDVDENPDDEFQVCLHEIRMLASKIKLQQISTEIEAAEQEGNEEKTNNLLQKFHQASQQNNPSKPRTPDFLKNPNKTSND